MEIEYNFDKPSSVNKNESKDFRKNLRVARSCSICKYYARKQQITNTYSKRGFCLYPKISHGMTQSKEKFNYPKTHANLLCDNFALASKAFTIDKITEWIEKPILADGTVKEE